MAYPINIARQFGTNKAHILKLFHEANVVLRTPEEWTAAIEKGPPSCLVLGGPILFLQIRGSDLLRCVSSKQSQFPSFYLLYCITLRAMLVLITNRIARVCFRGQGFNKTKIIIGLSTNHITDFSIDKRHIEFS